MIVFVGATLWAARGHLRDVARKVLWGAADVDDSSEIVSYRTAVVLLAAGGATLMGWLVWTGLPVFWAATFLFAALVIFFGLSRAVCESGIFLVWAPIVAPTFITSGFGAEALGFGKPVLCSDRGSLTEVGGDFVEYVDPWDLPGWVRAIERLWSDDGYRRRLADRITREYHLDDWSAAADAIGRVALSLEDESLAKGEP